jgi:hypothetical protein
MHEKSNTADLKKAKLASYANFLAVHTNICLKQTAGNGRKAKMAYNLTREEQETIIVFNESERTATVTTFNGALIRRLNGLCESRPSECSGRKTESEGEMYYEIPKKWVKVNPGLIMTDEQLQQRRDNLSRIKKS